MRGDNNSKMKVVPEIEEQYQVFRKLPIDNNTIRPYMALSIAIIRRFVVDLYVAYQTHNYKRVEHLKERIEKNGICELIGIDISYLDRIARTYDCNNYHKRDSKEDDFLNDLLQIKEGDD